MTGESADVGLLRREGGELGELILGFVADSYAAIPLDAKTRELIWLGMASATRAQLSAAQHVVGAIRAGATREEILATVAMTMVSAGMDAMLTTLRIAVDQFELAGNAPSSDSLSQQSRARLVIAIQPVCAFMP